MRILHLSYGNGPDDKRAWSGTVYKVQKALEATGATVDFMAFSPIKSPLLLHAFSFVLLFLQKIKLLDYKVLHPYTRLRIHKQIRFLRKQQLEGYDYFFILSADIMYSLMQVLKEKKINTKMILLADASYVGLEGYYPLYDNVLPSCSRYAHHIHRETWNACYKGILSSQWAKNHTVKGYGIDSSKLHVIEFGANIDTPILGTRTISFKDKTHYNILLSGVDWVRKGGEVAIECSKRLNSYGRGKFILHIVGMPVPEQHKALPFIKEYGFLNKNIPEQYAKYLAILEQMDIFLFPSRAECSATVLCEAAGLGLPTFCYETGGLANYVVNGKNGERLPLSATGKDFAEAIMNAIETDKLDDYSRGAQEMYNTRLNWNIWTQRVKNEILYSHR